MDAVTDQLQLEGFIKTENDEELKGKSFYVDRHCPDMLCFSSEQRHFFEEYTLVEEGHLVLQVSVWQ